MKPTKANLECADVIMQRNNVPSHIWSNLRRDIALSIDIAEREAVNKFKKQGKPKKQQ